MDSLCRNLQDHIIGYLPPGPLTCLGKTSRQWEKPCKDAALAYIEGLIRLFVNQVEAWSVSQDKWKMWVKGETGIAHPPKSCGVLLELVCKNKHGDADVFRELKRRFEYAIGLDKYEMDNPRLQHMPWVPGRKVWLEAMHVTLAPLFDRRVEIELNKTSICRLVDFLQPQPTQAKQHKFIHSIKPSTMIKYLRTLLHTLPRSLANKLCEPLTPEGVL